MLVSCSAKEVLSDRSRHVFCNEYVIAKTDVDPADQELPKLPRKMRAQPTSGPTGALSDQAGQTLEGSFSAVSKPNSASEYMY